MFHTIIKKFLNGIKTLFCTTDIIVDPVWKISIKKRCVTDVEELITVDIKDLAMQGRMKYEHL